MTANTDPVFEKTIHLGLKKIVNADGTNLLNLITGSAEGTRIDSIIITSDDTSIRYVNFYINDGSNDYHIGYVPVAIGAGYASVGCVLALQYLQPVLGFLLLPVNYILKVGVTVAVTAAKTVTISATGGDY